MLASGDDISRLTAHFDLFPTLIDLCGLRKPRDVRFDGASLAPLLRNPGSAWLDRTLLVESQRVQYPEIWRNCSVMTDRWRLLNGTDLYDIEADRGQSENVAASHPAVVRELRRSYEKLWKDISARDGDLGRPVIGSTHQEVVWFAADERFAMQELVPWNQTHVRAGNPIGGFWAAEIAADGTYEFAVRRWPKEVPKAISAGLPALVPDGVTRVGAAPAGKPLPLVKARLKIGGADVSAAVEDDAQEVVFRVPLKRGPVDIYAWLYDAAGGGSRGAYNVYARRLT